MQTLTPPLVKQPEQVLEGFSEFFSEILRSAEESNKKLRNSLPTGHEKLTSVINARVVADSHIGLIDIAKKLSSPTEDIREQAVKLAQDLLNAKHSNPRELTLEHAKLFIENELKISNKLVDKTITDNKASWKNIISSKSAEVEKEAGLVSRLFGSAVEKHDNFLEGKSEGLQSGIRIAEIAVGSVLTLKGMKWISQAIEGRKSSKVENITSDKLDQNQHTTTIIFEPMTATERTLKTALGLTTVAAGITGVTLGLVTGRH